MNKLPPLTPYSLCLVCSSLLGFLGPQVCVPLSTSRFNTYAIDLDFLILSELDSCCSLVGLISTKGLCAKSVEHPYPQLCRVKMMECHHKSMVRCPPYSRISKYLVPSWWYCLGRFRRCGFLEEVCHWRRALSFQKPCIVYSVLATACG